MEFPRMLRIAYYDLGVVFITVIIVFDILFLFYADMSAVSAWLLIVVISTIPFLVWHIVECAKSLKTLCDERKKWINVDRWERKKACEDGDHFYTEIVAFEDGRCRTIGSECPHCSKKGGWF